MKARGAFEEEDGYSLRSPEAPGFGARHPVPSALGARQGLGSQHPDPQDLRLFHTSQGQDQDVGGEQAESKYMICSGPSRRGLG